MPPKRKPRASPSSTGLLAGEHLQRNKLIGGGPWGWVGTEATNSSDITQRHLLETCGFSKWSTHPFCRNKFAQLGQGNDATPKNTRGAPMNGKLDDDIIVISDDEGHVCSKKLCRNNPNCLNYLGQQKWENEDEARAMFMKIANLGDSPILDARDPDLPVGLKNLGATCYANASLQVWFRDLAFRTGVYQCQPSHETQDRFKESPIFQLQVTFAALQESTQSVFNPAKLVESLQLCTTEQQDAQEFSKLFMSHLDAEFKKQTMPSLQSLITDQFQGIQVYGTICDRCSYRSERATDFLELEINFETNSTLEDRIAALIQPERLSDDNKYLCSHCNSLQDATRYTELRELPPVLHFSLLRFVYDIESMERKKSKHAISFPKTLDMNCFMGTTSAQGAVICDGGDNVYELRGVLLHKGASAYHGHYEAQVYDVASESWFQFNDETVTKITTLGDKGIGKATIPGVEDMSSGSQGRKHRANARKRQRIDDSDDEVDHVSKLSDLGSSNLISSKDAYMLIYARKEQSTQTFSRSDNSLQVVNGDPRAGGILCVPTPPAHALDIVNELNATHDKACDAFLERERKTEVAFTEARQRVMDIYHFWNISSSDESSVVVSQQALETWLSTHCIEMALQAAGDTNLTGNGHRSSESAVTTDTPSPRRMLVEEILCSHQLCDPKKAGNMKRITQEACARILRDTGCAFYPTLTPKDVCMACVVDIFTERLYQIEHPRLVSRFDRICEVGSEDAGHWISKQWLKDWRLVKPKMHVPSQGDPAPDTPEFNYHVRCEHGGLSLNTTTRRRISTEASELLMALYPSWVPVPADTELCAVCDALIHDLKEDKREIRKRAEDEKAKLKHMHDNTLNGNMALLENVPCAIIPAHFVRSWRRWLLRPTEIPRPDTVDNTPLICEHDLLAFDPNCSTDLDSSLAVIKRSDWDALKTLYSGGPLIALEKRIEGDGLYAKFIHEVPVCVGCRQKRMSDWDTTEITIRLSDANEPSTQLTRSVSNGIPHAPVTYSSRKTGVRQSKRLRQVREHGERRKLTISKRMTIKEIKIKLQDELTIPTICQRLFYRGQELDDNEVTVASLGIFAYDIIELRQESEIYDISSDSEITPVKKRRREEERGFDGTLLGGTADRSSSSREETPPSALDLAGKSCPACTFFNPCDAQICSMCDTVFG